MAFDTMKLGKKPPAVFDPKKHLLLANYLDPRALPPPAPTLWWGDRADKAGWTMSLNDQLGDCTIACAAHMIDEWTADIGTPVVVADGDVLAAYEAVSGYVPGDPSTDNGAVIADVLQYWQQTGVGGHKIDAYAAVETSNLSHVCTAIDLFGAVDIGVQLPLTAQSQNTIWSVVPNAGPDGQAGSWGGHSVPIIGHQIDSTGNGYFLVVTWGQKMWMTAAFYQAYVDEVWAAVSNDWISSQSISPSGFDLNGLLAAQQQL